MARVKLIFPDEDKAQFVRQARREGLTLSAWLRAAGQERLEARGSDRPRRKSGSELPDEPAPARLGFMVGQVDVPEDFDRMGGPEIEKMFGTTA